MSVISRVALRFIIDGATTDIPDVVTTFHVKYEPSGSPDAGDIGDLLSAVEEDWWPTANDHFSNKIELADLTYSQVDPLPAPISTVEPVGVDGAVDQAIMTPQDSIVFSWRTPLAGKSYRGRSYMPPPDRSRVGNDGLIDATSLGQFADDAVLLVDAVNGAGLGNVWTFGVWSRKLEVFTPVTSVKVGNRVDTMRSRAVATETYVTRTPA